MHFTFPPAAIVSVPIVGRAERFPVHRIYCVGRNYADHAKEMGYSGREPPFFFLKAADTLMSVPAGETGRMSYPSLTSNLHHEVELVIAIGRGGTDIKVEDALAHVWGYAVGLDMTRRDLQNAMKKEGRPWEIGKTFEQAAPIGAITPAADVPAIASAEISLQVNGVDRQRSDTGKLIWSIGEVIAAASTAWTLHPGDLIYTGTPEGVAAVVRGDLLTAHVQGLERLRVQLA